MEDREFYDLTNPQKSIYYTEQLFKGTSIANISGTLHIETKINFEMLEKAVQMVIKANDALRTRIVVVENNPVQYFGEYQEYSVDLVDVEDENELNNLIKKLVTTPFLDKNENMFRFTMFRFPNGNGGCNIIHSHLISDAWSATLICSEVVKNYLMLLNNDKNIAKESCSYKQFIEQEKAYYNSEKYIKDKEYWQNKYDTIPDLATTNLDNVEDKTCNANRISYTLTQKESKEITEYCKQNKVSVYCFFLTIYSIYLSRITGIDKIVLGTPLLNRKNIAEKCTLGMYVNTVPININLAQNKCIKEIFDETTKEILSIMRHQKYSYIDLLEYIRNKFNVNRGLYDVIISYQNAKTTVNTTEIPYLAKWDFNGCISETMNIHISDINTTDRLNIYYDYQIAKHSKEDIVNLHNRIMYIAKQIIDNYQLLLDDIDIVPDNEKKIIKSLNMTNVKYPTNKTIVDLFEEQVKLTPNNIAITIKNETITYKELNNKSNQLAYFLIQKGITKGIKVAIRINKSIEMVIGILAIIKAGGCYLPIDLSYPMERIEFMIDDSKAKLLLTNKKSNISIKNIEVIEIDNKEVYTSNTNNPKIDISSDDLLYIIYTSGSTGTPKGTMLTHKNVVRLMKNDKYLFDFSDKDIWTMFHSVAFDFSVWEMYGALLYGGKLVLVPEDIAKSPLEFLNLLRKEKVTVLNQTPTFFYNLLDCELKNKDKDLCVRYIIYGGEALKPNLVKAWKDKYEFTKLINMYGITETTVHVTYKELSNDDMEKCDSNIGKPIPTLKVYILDKKQRLLPLGIEGEICVAGAGVSKGYLNREELNKQKFIKNPYNDKEILYRSADSAILKSDGNLYYRGRIDTQVKIRGFRVELGEIESKLLKHPSISKCIVLADKNSDKDSHLVAYIVCNKDVKIEELKTYLKDLVPPYMIPNYFVKIKQMPLNSNGKVDRKYLKTLNYTIEQQSAYVEPRNEFEKVLANIVESELKIKKIGIDEDIIELGADSLSLMRITAELLEKDYAVNIQTFYEQKTIRNISDALSIQNADVENLGDIKTDINFEFDNNFSNEKIAINNILLTGATGFLGIHILHDLLNHTNANIYCLIRDKDNKDGVTRLQNKIKFYFESEYSEIVNQIGKRIFIIKGDIAKEKFALEENEYKTLGYKIDVLIHCAAIVNHYGKEEVFEKINVIGTNNVIEFCKEYHIKLNHISTLSVSADFVANKKLDKAFTEKTLFIGQPYQKNIYVKTKFEAEYNIWKEKDNGLDFIIYRLGNITSRYKDGKFQENDYQNAFLNRILNFIKLGITTEEILNYEFDMSPVDICSNFITQIMQYSTSYNKVFHIVNDKKVTLKTVLEKLRIEDFKVVTKQELMQHIKNSKNKLGIVNDITSKSLLIKNIEINSNFTKEYLSKLGLRWEDINEEYIKKYIMLGEI